MKAHRKLHQLIFVALMFFYASAGLAADGSPPPLVAVDAFTPASPVQLTVKPMTKTMGDLTNVDFWVFCDSVAAAAGTCTLPGPILELNIGTGGTAAADFSLVMMGRGQWPSEGMTGKYAGHTIHSHGLDVSSEFDGVPETLPVGIQGIVGVGSQGNMVTDYNYNFSVTDKYIGSHMYHCHVHTVKHLEMGMYGAPNYVDEWIWVLSTVDPRYHAVTAVDDTVFASYDAQYFLINGHESGSIANGLASPSESKIVNANENLVIRLIGLHSLNAKFQILNAAKDTNMAFTVHNIDGFVLASPQTVTSVEVSPGQTKDIIVTPGNNDLGDWFPQITYASLRRPQPPSAPDLVAPLDPNDLSFGTVYTRLIVE